MANFPFRAALQGRMDYSYRCQLNSYLVGAQKTFGVNVRNAMWVCYRKETSHLLEVFCSKGFKKVETRIFTPAGGWAQYSPETSVEEPEWEQAEVLHPFDPSLHEEVTERFRQVIHSTPKDLPTREYGPRTNCQKCDGNGYYLTEKRKEKKSCKECSGTGEKREIRLEFPCSHCRFKTYCWERLQFKGYEGPNRSSIWTVPKEVAKATEVKHIAEQLRNHGQEVKLPLQAELELF